MKKIRLEFPLQRGKKSKNIQPEKIFLKVIENHTEAFKDKEFKQFIPKTEKKISLEVEVPEELESIEVIQPIGVNVVNNISMSWCFAMADPKWRIPGLKDVSIIIGDKEHKVDVINEKPDFDGWEAYIKSDGPGAGLFMKSWALVVYTLESKTIAGFYWNAYKLAGIGRRREFNRQH